MPDSKILINRSPVPAVSQHCKGTAWQYRATTRLQHGTCNSYRPSDKAEVIQASVLMRYAGWRKASTIRFPGAW